MRVRVFRTPRPLLVLNVGQHWAFSVSAELRWTWNAEDGLAWPWCRRWSIGPMEVRNYETVVAQRRRLLNGEISDAEAAEVNAEGQGRQAGLLMAQTTGVFPALTDRVKKTPKPKRK